MGLIFQGMDGVMGDHLSRVTGHGYNQALFGMP
jgi:hypothetical protein